MIVKRTLLILLLILTVLSLTACDWADSTPEGMYGFLDDIAGFFGSSQITDDDELIGTRKLADDTYTGAYTSDCAGITGRDVIFGGGSILNKTLSIEGQIRTESGSAVIRIRMNDEIIELEPDSDGCFDTELNIHSGGNYIMIDYSDFAGSVELHSKYVNGSAQE